MKIDRSVWPRLSPLLDEALALDAENLAAWLTLLDTEQPDIAEPLRALLARRADVETDGFLDTLPAIRDLGVAGESASAEPTLRAGARVGPYVLESELGHGGMGTVWLASGVGSTLRRAVALKLLHSGAYGADLLERFARERDILAALEHPHIARLYDAGISDAGQPYLALEYVAGAPLDSYCDTHALPVRNRLLLFRQVLGAVAFAHSRLVIHRDLKPSNVLVTPAGEARLLDFGVAKLLREAGAPDQALTQMSARVITPRYAAPEQISGGTITTATDVYALGAVLYELLAGCSPYRPARDSRGALEDAILDADPLPPSKAFSAEAATRRATTPARLRATLRGDLDTIVLKALKKRPVDRYATVAALLQDIDNFLAGIPVLAHADSGWYRLNKFVRRHRTATAFSAALAASLVLGTVAVGWQALKARDAAVAAEREARRAETEARREKATKDFLISVFSATDPRLPSDTPRGSIPAGELLSASADRIEKDFASDPDTAIELLGIVTEILAAVQDFDRYRPLHARYVELVTSRYGELDPRAITGLLDEADSAIDHAELERAAGLLARTDELIRRAGRDHSKERALWWSTQADLLREQSAAAPERAAALEKSIALYADVAPTDEAFASVLSSLGGVRYRQDDDDAAIALYRRAIEVLQAGYGPDYAELGTLYLNLAGPEEEKGDFDAALRDFAHATAIIRKTYGAQHGHYLGAAADQARLLHRRGQREQADEVFEGLMRSSSAGPTVYRNAVLAQIAAVIREDYGECLVSEGRPQRAVVVLSAALAIFESAALFSDYRDAFAVHLGLGNAYLALGRLNAARGELVPLVTKLAASKEAGSPLLMNAREALGRLELRSGNERAARSAFDQLLTASGGKPSGAVARAYADLAGAALARNDLTAASELSGKAVAAADAARTEPDIRLHPIVWDMRARVLLRAGDVAAALRLSQQAMAVDRMYFDPASSELANAARTRQLIEAANAASARSGFP